MFLKPIWVRRKLRKNYSGNFKSFMKTDIQLRSQSLEEKAKTKAKLFLFYLCITQVKSPYHTKLLCVVRRSKNFKICKNHVKMSMSSYHSLQKTFVKNKFVSLSKNRPIETILQIRHLVFKSTKRGNVSSL